LLLVIAADELEKRENESKGGVFFSAE